MDTAQFWWQFAAGSGSATTAYLHHLTLGETLDATHWRGQAENVPAKPQTRRAFQALTPLTPPARAAQESGL
ncbi:hypothetical protein [Kitasatospora sp. NPDC006786]|uniref:hypothetical protein n=1 Tax=unclassified Kitasatospora TaxID=2633591 RepID=UPI0033C3273F